MDTEEPMDVTTEDDTRTDDAQAEAAPEESGRDELGGFSANHFVPGLNIVAARIFDRGDVLLGGFGVGCAFHG